MEISSVDEFLVPVWSQLGKRVYWAKKNIRSFRPEYRKALDSGNEIGTSGTAGYSVDIAQHSLSLAAGSE
jgi:hypothetical protein